MAPVIRTKRLNQIGWCIILFSCLITIIYYFRHSRVTNSIIKFERMPQVKLRAQLDLMRTPYHISTVNRVTKIASAATPLQPLRNEKPGIKGRLHVVTYASHGGRDDRFCRAVESSIRNEFNLTILGWGKTWRGLSQKLEAAHAYASSMPEKDVMLFVDAFDTMFVGSTDDILNNFRKSNASLLFSAECGCWPHIIERVADMAVGSACFSGPNSYPVAPTPYRYLNSGAWIGYAKEAKDMLAEVISLAGSNFANANDQKLIADMFISSKHGIKLDYWATIFQSMHLTLDDPLPHCNPSEDVTLSSFRAHDGEGAPPRNKLYNSRTKTFPSVIHFNGGGKRSHLKMESQAWYKAANHNTIDIKEQLAQQVLKMPGLPGDVGTFESICPGYVKL